MRRLALVSAGLLCCVGSAAHAQSAGPWRINGAIAGRTFVLDCRLEARGGVCVDAESGGKRSHPLASLTSSGDQIAWSFKTKAMMMSITLNFDGRIAGDRISGTMRAAGRSGTFTGQRR